MARIKTYTTDTTLNPEDKWIGTDGASGADNGKTKNFTIQAVSDYVVSQVSVDEPKYKVYTALLTQSGTDAPVATVLENTLGGTPTWSYDSTGYYYLNGTGLFNGDIVVIGGLGASTDHYLISFTNDYSIDSVNIFVSRLNNIGAGGNDLLFNTPIEIRVYN